MFSYNKLHNCDMFCYRLLHITRNDTKFADELSKVCFFVTKKKSAKYYTTYFLKRSILEIRVTVKGGNIFFRNVICNENKVHSRAPICTWRFDSSAMSEFAGKKFRTGSLDICLSCVTVDVVSAQWSSGILCERFPEVVDRNVFRKVERTWRFNCVSSSVAGPISDYFM